MPTIRTLLLSLAALLVAGVTPAGAATAPTPPGMPPTGTVLLGVGGHALTPRQFDSVAGGRHGIHLVTVPWDESRSWNWALDNSLGAAASGGYRLMLHIGPQRSSDGREGRSPGAVSRGLADRYFLDMSRVINDSGQTVYVRPPAEMNGHWSLWSAFNRSGSRRDSDHSTRSYRRAFMRIALIARGGDVATINATLVRNAMPRLATSATTLPRSGRIATVFNPQAEGSPNVRGNQPQDYYPGRAVVDYVANDLYVQSGRAHWTAHEELYRRYAPVHPFMVAEYAPWGYDDPAFVRRMFRWAATHPRNVALIYFNGTSGKTFRLSTKPRSLAAYRTLVKQRQFRCAGLDAFSDAC